MTDPVFWGLMSALCLAMATPLLLAFGVVPPQDQLESNIYAATKMLIVIAFAAGLIAGALTLT